MLYDCLSDDVALEGLKLFTVALCLYVAPCLYEDVEPLRMEAACRFALETLDTLDAVLFRDGFSPAVIACFLVEEVAYLLLVTLFTAFRPEVRVAVEAAPLVRNTLFTLPDDVAVPFVALAAVFVVLVILIPCTEVPEEDVELRFPVPTASLRLDVMAVEMEDELPPLDPEP